MARVLITRAQPQADATARSVAAEGFDPLVMPLTQTETLQDGVDAVKALGAQSGHVMVATSARAIDVLLSAGLGPWVSGQRWAVVGARAANAVSRLGATLIMPPADTVAGLVEGLRTQRAPLVYLAGADRKPALEAHFPAMRVIPVYQAKALGGFSANAKQQLSTEPPAFALVYSSRGASLLGQAIDGLSIEEAGLKTTLREMSWLCLSDDVAAYAPSGVLAHSADGPTEEALLRLLKHMR